MGEDVLVVGAGISGLYAALLLARRGARVRVIERAARPGGLASAELFRGIPCDLGSHRLHPEALDRPLFREIHAEEPLLARPRRGVLLASGARVPYPPTAAAMVRALGLSASLSLAYGLAAHRRQRRAFTAWDRDRASTDDAGFEAFVTERVGREAYRAFYEPYGRKVWGVHPGELSQIVAKKRMSSAHPVTLLRGLLSRAASSLLGRPPAVSPIFLYPARGIASITGYLATRLAALGVPIELGRPFLPGDQGGRPVLFAGDLADLVPTPLRHRGLYLVYLAFACDRLSQAETYYCPDASAWFGRVSELQNYAPALRRPGETILCVEIPEGSWGRDLDFTSGARASALLAQLVRAGIVPEGARPIEARQRFLPSVYPLYLRGWLPRWREAMAEVARLGGVLPIGRQALFLHCNLDHCADIAEEAVAHLASGASTAAWTERAERFLEVPVRD